MQYAVNYEDIRGVSVIENFYSLSFFWGKKPVVIDGAFHFMGGTVMVAVDHKRSAAEISTAPRPCNSSINNGRGVAGYRVGNDL